MGDSRRKKLFEVGLPPPKIIVHVDRGDAALRSRVFSAAMRRAAGRAKRRSFGLRKIEVIDDIDEQEHRL
jgi:hypothetical protein